MTTQASDVCEKPRSARIDGSATLTIVVSRTIIRLPMQRTTSANQRFRPSIVVWRVSLSVIAVMSASSELGVIPYDPQAPENSSHARRIPGV